MLYALNSCQAPRRTATLQLCAPEQSPGDPESPVWGTAFIFHLCHIKPRPGVTRNAESSTAPSSNSLITRAAAVDGIDPAASPHDDTSPPGQRGDARGVRGGGESAGAEVGALAVDGFVLPDSLVRVLSDPGIVLAGVSIGGDVSRLEREYAQLRECGGVNGIVELSELAKRKVRVAVLLCLL